MVFSINQNKEIKNILLTKSTHNGKINIEYYVPKRGRVVEKKNIYFIGTPAWYVASVSLR